MKKYIVLALGFCLIILGVTLILRNWDALVLVFNALIGPVVAVGGLVVMFMATIKSSE